MTDRAKKILKSRKDGSYKERAKMVASGDPAQVELALAMGRRVR